MVHRFPRFHNKKESYILCFQTEMEAFLLLGKLVCQKSWCLNSSFPCQSQTFSSFPRCRARKRKQHERMLVKHSTALGCQSYCRKETHTVSLVILRQKIIMSCSRTLLALRPTQSVFQITKWEKNRPTLVQTSICILNKAPLVAFIHLYKLHMLQCFCGF